MIEVPARYVNKIGSVTDKTKNNINGITRLLVLKDKRNGGLSSALMQVHGEPGTDINKVHYMDLPQNFSGHVFYTTLQGAFINGNMYNDGKIIYASQGAVTGTDTKPDGPQVLQVPAPGDCSTVIIDYYERTCTSYSNGYETCSGWSYLYTEQFTYCTPANDGGGGSGGGINPTPSCPPVTNPPAPPTGVAWVDGRRLVINLVQGGDPGACPVKPPTTANYKIDQSKLKPCMQQILSKLQTLSKGSVAAIMQKFAGSSVGYNWTLKDGTLGTSVNAQTNPVYNRATGTVTTTFDTQKFQNASDLSIARTLLHETVHAYLVTYFATNPITGNNVATSQYPTLITEYYKTQNLPLAQHNEMTRTFISDIATALSQYATTNGYNITDPKYFADMAWGGLATDNYGNPTQMFLNLVPNQTDRDRIQNTLQIELTGIDLNGKPQVKKGKAGGC